VAIKTEGVLGGKIIEISTGEEEEPLDLTQPIIGETPYMCRIGRIIW